VANQLLISTKPIQQKTSSELSQLKLICLAPAVLYDGIFFLLPLIFLIWIGFWIFAV
jgi:spermidine/putrescine transport system permease protein